jgi:hypothetical protein
MKLTFEHSGKTVILDDQFIEWAEAYQTSMMDAHELINLAAVLKGCPWNKGEFVVEIGAYLGTTTVFMAKVLEHTKKRVPILSIDPFERFESNPLNPQGSYSSYVESIITNHVEDVCLPLGAFSENAAPVIADNIRVLVIDGGHEYPAISKDLELYVPKVREGGYVFIDDYGPAYPDIVRAVDEFLAKNPEFVVHARSYFVVAERPARHGKQKGQAQTAMRH